jgi:hypothetical protein
VAALHRRRRSSSVAHGQWPISSRRCGFVLPCAALSIGSDRRCWRACSFWPPWPIQCRRGRAAPLVPSDHAGEHARGPVSCTDHDPASLGDGDRSRRLFGQSRPNPTCASSLRTAHHFPGTPASRPGHFASVREMPRSRRERWPGEDGRGRRGLADAESLSRHVWHRQYWERPKVAERGVRGSRKSRTETMRSVGRFLRADGHEWSKLGLALSIETFARRMLLGWTGNCPEGSHSQAEHERIQSGVC